MKIELTRTKVIKGDINRALKRFKSATAESGHLEELRDRKQYTKPTTKKRKMMKDAVRKLKWDLEKEKEVY